MSRLSAVEFIAYVKGHRCESCEHKNLLDEDELNKCGVRLPVICVDNCWADYHDHIREVEG